MDPFVISIIVVVVTYFVTIYILLRRSTTFRGEQTETTTVLPLEDAKSQQKGQFDNSRASLEVTESSTQTDNGSSFYTFYEHTQAQRQETLLVEEQLERTLQQFDRSLSDIIEHQDRNFHFLAHKFTVRI